MVLRFPAAQDGGSIQMIRRNPFASGSIAAAALIAARLMAFLNVVRF